MTEKVDSAVAAIRFEVAQLMADRAELVRLARRARAAQVAYFAHRDRDSLIASKEAERALDALLKRFPHDA